MILPKNLKTSPILDYTRYLKPNHYLLGASHPTEKIKFSAKKKKKVKVIMGWYKPLME